jgi:hypothetical protein
VYNLFFPHEFRFLCNPDRPAVCGRFGLESDRLWRFEFVVRKGEDGIKMASPEETRKIIFPYLTHPGSRYGLRQAVRFPDDCIAELRSRPFSFQARSCNKWALGRVILAGDAAHVFPPFGGQGIASGFRDALGLAWRLVLLHLEPECNHDNIIRAWYLERKQQLERSLAATIQNGEYVTQSNPTKAFIRDWSLWLIQMVPSWKRELEKGPRAQGMTQYQHQPSLPFLHDSCGGKLLPQVYAWDFATERVKFSDDIIFAAGKRGLFQLLLLSPSTEDAKDLVLAAKRLPRNAFIDAEEATVLIQNEHVQSSQIQLLTSHGLSVARVATGEEFAATPDLCRNRPAPTYYDPYRISKEFKGMTFVVVRPDRFVYAACRTPAELIKTVDGLAGVLLS